VSARDEQSGEPEPPIASVLNPQHYWRRPGYRRRSASKGTTMGFVWNVMLSFDNEEVWEDGADDARETCDRLDQINSWFEHG